MTGMKGPGIFLAQFVSDEKPFATFADIVAWAGDLGYKGIQVPTWDSNLVDLDLAADSKTYCDELKGICQDSGVEITELSTHLQGQLIAVNPAYDALFDAFAPEAFRGNRTARQAWATNQLFLAAKASQNLGLNAHATFSGALLWHTVYPWPQRPTGLVETGFAALAERWIPILNAFDAAGVDLCYEIHPGEDLHDGISFERFLEATGNHARCNILYDPSHFLLQQLDYSQFIDHYYEHIKMFHVKDAEFNPTGKSGVYGGYQNWKDRAGRFRSLGDGQVDFSRIFSQLAKYGYQGWAVLEWECCLKDPEDGAREGVEFITKNIIRTTEKAFDDFAGLAADDTVNRRILHL
ncbi:sugar phosphate isomerase/epimerase [Congregibacter brevis]|uniref:Sugar phosphate isomerase/epimerase n=1 Tax=Congregibacter brevis TaxID=3081201 RepID=A0ABZ0IGK5_9GAMM|nr:sugar phosphate isomerase/epimerase [Congregibacter sp. IMCC45268]